MNYKFNKNNSFFGVWVLLIALIAINFVANKFFFRLDMTEENLYTLSDGTKKIIREIDDLTTIKFFFSTENNSIPQSYRLYAKRVTEILEEYVALNSANLKLEILDPKPDSDEELAASGYKISGADLGSAYKLYFGMAVIKDDKQETIPFFDLRRQQSLEYDITQAIYRITQEQKTVIGIVSDLEIGGNPVQPGSRWTFYDELSKSYEVRSLRGDTIEISQDVNLLIVLHPKNVVNNPTQSDNKPNTTLEYAIDQFLLRGGQVMVMVDPFMRSDNSVATNRGQVSVSDLPKLFKHWGIDYQKHNVAADFERPHLIRNQGQTIPYFLWHVLSESAFSKNIPALQNLENVLFAEPGSFSFKNDKLDFQPIITTSEKSGTFFSRGLASGNLNAINNSIRASNKQVYLAGLINGKFTTAFKERPKLEIEYEFKQEHLTESATKNSVLVINDVDWINDSFSVRKLKILNQTIIQPSNDNLALFLNLVEYLSGSDKLFSIRTRGKFSRPFDKITELEKVAQENYRQLENQLQDELKDIQNQLSQLKPKAGSDKVILNKEQFKKIKNFQNQERDTKIKLREIRKLLRQDIEFLESSLKFINLVIIPIIALFIGLFVFYKRYYLIKKTK